MDFTWQYYDLVLLGIGASVALGAGIGLLTELELTVTVVATSVVAIGIIGHGMFVNGPVEEPADLTDEVETLN